MFTVKPLKYSTNETLNPTSWIYLHGELEKKNGFDLVHIEEDLPVVDDIFDCNVIIDGNSYAGKFYFWRVPERIRGIVVGADDVEGNEYAKQKFDERAAFI